MKIFLKINGLAAIKDVYSYQAKNQKKENTRINFLKINR